MTYDNFRSSEKNLIIRKAKKNNFSIINNSLLQNVNLSWKAKGLLCYLLHLPDHWKINLSHLEKQATDGKASLSTGMKELKKLGYVTYKKIKEKGKIVAHEWTVYEESLSKNDIDCKKPEPENRIMEGQKPETDFPVLENRSLVSTNDMSSLDNSIVEKTEKNIAPGGALSADADALLSFFIEKLKERKPDIRITDRKRWLIEIDRMIRVDKRDPKKIRAMIEWIHRDSFWSTNILSTRKLREQYDQIELQAIGKFNKKNMTRNKEYTFRLKHKFPETFKNLALREKYVENPGTGKEISLNLPHESFKPAFVRIFGGEYNLSD